MSSFGGSEVNAFQAVEAAAQNAYANGTLVVEAGGYLPRSAGNVFNINGTLVQLSGGRVIDGQVRIGSFGSVIRLGR